MNAIGYCRVSTEEQVIEGFSLETQEREIKRYCQDNNINLQFKRLVLLSQETLSPLKKRVQF